jgi:hypothetical protein
MSIVSTGRASYQAKPVVPGYGRKAKEKRRKVRPIATHTEESIINQAIVSLNSAKRATEESAFLLLISNSFKLSRDLFRSRSDL